MEKFFLNDTYGYKNFISDETKEIFLTWIDKNLETFSENPNGPNRKFRVIEKKDSIFEHVQNLKNKIIEIEKITQWTIEPIFGDYFGINYKGGKIHLHRDNNAYGKIHTRWNLILSYPLEGGHSIYNEKINVLEENLIWKCVAGIYGHGSTEVVGEKPRITLSLGFLI